MRPRWPEFELVGLALELGPQRLAQPAHRRQHLLQRLAQPVRRLEQAGIERAHVAFLAEALVLARGARAHLLAHQGQELLGRTEDGAVDEPRLPVGRGQLLGEVEQAAQRLMGFEVVAQKIAEAPFQAAGAAAAAALGAQKPAPEVGGFDAAEMRGEGAVGGVEQVMALVEHVAQRPRGVVEAAHRRLHHDQRVVGDHDVGLAGAADGAFDEALPVVLARRVDAFAAPVGEPRDAAAAQKVEQPGRQVAAHHVAVAAVERPARQQAEPDGVLGREAGAHHRLLEVQQAEIVLAALADHHLAPLLGRIAVQPVELVVDLALQVAGVGGDPDRRAVLLGPQARRRDIAQGLADARAGLDQHDVGLVLALARREGLGGGRGVVALCRPRLGDVGAGRDHLGQPQARLARLDRMAGGRRRGRRLLPLRQALPDIEAGAGPELLAGRVDAQRGQHGVAPRPLPARHGERGFGELARGQRRHVLELVEQHGRHLRQGGDLFLGRRRHRQIERLAEAARRGQAELRRPHEGEELQKIERRQVVQAKPRRHRRRVADERRAGRRAHRGVGRLQPLDRAVGPAPQRAARGRDQGRPVVRGQHHQQPDSIQCQSNDAQSSSLPVHVDGRNSASGAGRRSRRGHCRGGRRGPCRGQKPDGGQQERAGGRGARAHRRPCRH